MDPFWMQADKVPLLGTSGYPIGSKKNKIPAPKSVAGISMTKMPGSRIGGLLSGGGSALSEMEPIASDAPQVGPMPQFSAHQAQAMPLEQLMAMYRMYGGGGLLGR